MNAPEALVEVERICRGEAKGAITWTTTLIYETGLAASTPAADPCG